MRKADSKTVTGFPISATERGKINFFSAAVFPILVEISIIFCYNYKIPLCKVLLVTLRNAVK